MCVVHSTLKLLSGSIHVKSFRKIPKGQSNIMFHLRETNKTKAEQNKNDKKTSDNRKKNTKQKTED